MFYQRDKLLNDILFFLYALFIFGSTFSIALAQSAFGLSLVVFLVIAIRRRYNPFQSSLKWFYLSVGLYILWMIIACLMGDTPVRSLRIMKEEWLFAIVPVGVYLMSKEGYRQKLLLAFAVGVGIFALYGILQHFTGVHWTKKTPPFPAPDFGYVVKGTFPHRLTFGNYYATAALFMLAIALSGWKKMTRNGRLFYLTVGLLAVIATIFTYSRGAILALTLALLLLGIFLGRRAMAYVGGAAAAVVVLALLIAFPGVIGSVQQKMQREYDLKDDMGRLFIWTNSLRIVGENPIFGVGQGNFYEAYVRLRPADVTGTRNAVHAHSDPINVAAIAGLPGMVFFLGIWVSVLCYCWRGWRRADPKGISGSFYVAGFIGSVAFFLSSITEATFADEEVRQMLMFVWAVGLWQVFYPQSAASGNQKPGPIVKDLDKGTDLKLNG